MEDLPKGVRHWDDRREAGHDGSGLTPVEVKIDTSSRFDIIDQGPRKLLSYKWEPLQDADPAERACRVQEWIVRSPLELSVILVLEGNEKDGRYANTLDLLFAHALR
jgi:hypothetical protein